MGVGGGGEAAEGVRGRRKGGVGGGGQGAGGSKAGKTQTERDRPGDPRSDWDTDWDRLTQAVLKWQLLRRRVDPPGTRAARGRRGAGGG